MRSAYLFVPVVLLMTGVACADSSDPAFAAESPPELSTAMATGQHQSRSGDELHWGPAPAAFPAGAEMAVLQGDPGLEGAVFTVRLRFPNGYVIPAHWHPTDEYVTVLEGAFLVGLGDRFSEATLMPPLRRGGFITAPAQMNHFAMARGLTVVQVHAIGPFQMTYVNPEDVPRQ